MGFFTGNMRHIARIASAVALMMLMGCGGGNNRNVSDELTRNRILWSSRGVSSYRYTLQVMAFLAPSVSGPVRIEVRNGKTVSVQPVDPELKIQEAAFDDYATVEKLFNYLETSRAKKPFSMTMKFAPSDGHPISTFIDSVPELADEETGFTVTDFKAL